MSTTLYLTLSNMFFRCIHLQVRVSLMNLCKCHRRLLKLVMETSIRFFFLSLLVFFIIKIEGDINHWNEPKPVVPPRVSLQPKTEDQKWKPYRSPSLVLFDAHLKDTGYNRPHFTLKSLWNVKKWQSAGELNGTLLMS